MGQFLLRTQSVCCCPDFQLKMATDFQLISKNSAGEFEVPVGWSRVGYHQREDSDVMKARRELIDSLEKMGGFDSGEMVLIRKGEREKDEWRDGPYEEWDVLKVANKEDVFDVPDGWEIVEMDRSNYGGYMDKITYMFDPSMLKGMEEGTITFIRKRLRFCGVTDDYPGQPPLLE